MARQKLKDFQVLGASKSNSKDETITNPLQYRAAISLAAAGLLHFATCVILKDITEKKMNNMHTFCHFLLDGLTQT